MNISENEDEKIHGQGCDGCEAGGDVAELFVVKELGEALQGKEDDDQGTDADAKEFKLYGIRSSDIKTSL